MKKMWQALGRVYGTTLPQRGKGKGASIYWVGTRMFLVQISFSDENCIFGLFFVDMLETIFRPLMWDLKSRGISP